MSKQNTIKNIGSFVLRFGLSGLLLWYLFSKVDIAQTSSIVRSANLAYLVIALAIFFITNILLIIRWLIFIKALKLQVPTRDVVRFFFIGLFGNLFLPSAIGGDIIKIIGLCKGSNEKPKVVASTLLDRLSGFAGMSILAVVTFILGFKLINDVALMIPVIVLGVGSLGIGLILFCEPVYAFFCKAFNFLPKFKQALMQMHYDIALLKGAKIEGFKAIGLSILGQIIFALVFYFIALSLNQNVSLIYFFIFVPLICVASSVPSIGGLGVREAGAAYLFGRIGIETGVAVSISLMVFIFMVIVGLIGGAVYVFTVSSGRLQHHPSDADGIARQA